jgi:hypothetical protein
VLAGCREASQDQGVEGVPDEDMLTVEGDNSGTTTQNQKERIIAHAYLEVGDQFI